MRIKMREKLMYIAINTVIHASFSEKDTTNTLMFVFSNSALNTFTNFYDSIEKSFKTAKSPKDLVYDKELLTEYLKQYDYSNITDFKEDKRIPYLLNTFEIILESSFYLAKQLELIVDDTAKTLDFLSSYGVTLHKHYCKINRLNVNLRDLLRQSIIFATVTEKQEKQNFRDLWES